MAIQMTVIDDLTGEGQATRTTRVSMDGDFYDLHVSDESYQQIKKWFDDLVARGMATTSSAKIYQPEDWMQMTLGKALSTKRVQKPPHPEEAPDSNGDPVEADAPRPPAIDRGEVEPPAVEPAPPAVEPAITEAPDAPLKVAPAQTELKIGATHTAKKPQTGQAPKIKNADLDPETRSVIRDWAKTNPWAKAHQVHLPARGMLPQAVIDSYFQFLDTTSKSGR